MKSSSDLIIYITHDQSIGSEAAVINSTRRAAVLREVGFQVEVYPHKLKNFFRDFWVLTKKIRHAKYVYIRIDGSMILDKFTLLKLVSPNAKFIWEIHGFPEENYDTNYATPALFVRQKNHLKRYALSCLIDASIFVSQELQRFAKSKMVLHKNAIIPNFVNVPNTLRQPTAAFHLLCPDTFVVLWGGFTQLHWQGIDILEHAAKHLYTKDPSIIFLVVGDSGWHKFLWRKNILLLNSMPRDTFLEFVARSNICLALYHKPTHVPFYFSPLKILDYMMYRKPIIATNQPSIASIIFHDHNGMLTDNNPRNLARQILRLKRNPALSKRFGKNAFKVLQQKYSQKTATAAYRSFFNSLA